MQLIKFSATWCAPCKALESTLATIDSDLIRSKISYDVDAEYKKAMEYGVRSVPTMILTDSAGNAIRTLAGNKTKEEIIEFLK